MLRSVDFYVEFVSFFQKLFFFKRSICWGYFLINVYKTVLYVQAKLKLVWIWFKTTILSTVLLAKTAKTSYNVVYY